MIKQHIQHYYNNYTTYLQQNNNTYTTIKQQIPPIRAYFFSQKRILAKYQ